MPPSRNGTRQPQASIWSGVRTWSNSAAMPEPSSKPGDHAHLLEAAVEAALVLRRPLDDVGGGRAPFAAGREALHQPRDDEQQRRRDADRRVGRQEADQHGADRHQRDGDEQRGLAPMRVADAAENDSAERARDEAEPIGEEGREQRGDFIALRKEFSRDDDRHKGVDREIVPLEHVADDRRADGAARLRLTAITHGLLPQSPRKAPFPCGLARPFWYESVGRSLRARNRAATSQCCGLHAAGAGSDAISWAALAVSRRENSPFNCRP